MNISNESLLGLLIKIGISKHHSVGNIYQCINSTNFLERAIIPCVVKMATAKLWILPLRYIRFCYKREVKRKHFLGSLGGGGQHVAETLNAAGIQSRCGH